MLQTGGMDEPDPSGDQDKHLVRVRMKKSELQTLLTVDVLGVVH